LIHGHVAVGWRWGAGRPRLAFDVARRFSVLGFSARRADSEVLAPGAMDKKSGPAGIPPHHIDSRAGANASAKLAFALGHDGLLLQPPPDSKQPAAEHAHRSGWQLPAMSTVSSHSLPDRAIT